VLNESLVGAEIRQSKAIQRHTKVRKTMACGVGGELLGERNGFSLSGSEHIS
jgi:hypothetical protein